MINNPDFALPLIVSGFGMILLLYFKFMLGSQYSTDSRFVFMERILFGILSFGILIGLADVYLHFKGME